MHACLGIWADVGAEKDETLKQTEWFGGEKLAGGESRNRAGVWGEGAEREAALRAK